MTGEVVTEVAGGPVVVVAGGADEAGGVVAGGTRSVVTGGGLASFPDVHAAAASAPAAIRHQSNFRGAVMSSW